MALPARFGTAQPGVRLARPYIAALPAIQLAAAKLLTPIAWAATAAVPVMLIAPIQLMEPLVRAGKIPAVAAVLVLTYALTA